ncbi:MAG TPA: hypothetical protein VKR82_04765 [Candidatus Acidoferrales bacterium]|nr:hypothetical protein [Candidatus Acidoferrales bacterium]
MGAHSWMEKSKKMEKIIPIPPTSVVRLSNAPRNTPRWRKDLGRIFRVGYYSRQDGLDCVWLVNDEGKYEQTTDHGDLFKYFDVIHLANEKSLYGRGKPPFPFIRPADKRKSKRRVSGK